MLPPVIIIIGPHSKTAPGELTSTMAENAIQDPPQFDVRCERDDLSFAEQADLLRAAADQLDPPINGKNED
jgi:hypothetical protein